MPTSAHSIILADAAFLPSAYLWTLVVLCALCFGMGMLDLFTKKGKL